MSRGLQIAHAGLTVSLLALVGWLIATRPAVTEVEVSSLRDEIATLREDAEASGDRERATAARADSAERRSRTLTEDLAAQRSRRGRPLNLQDAGSYVAGENGDEETDDDLTEEQLQAREAARKAAVAQMDVMKLQTAEMTSVMDGLGARIKSIKLRQLQPHERWDKAREVLDLNDVQVDEIRNAIEERDGGYESATQIDHVDTDNGPETHTEVDERAVEDADRLYAERIDRALTEEQRDAWRNEGFSQSFGRVRPRDGKRPTRGPPR